MDTWRTNNERAKRRAVALISGVPFTRMIALTGSLAEDRETKNSDIDFFIQIKPGHIWLSRAIITILIGMAGIRRTDTSIAGKICLNWYATFKAPEKQGGRAYNVLWQEKPKLPILKSFFEFLFSGYMGKLLENIARNYQIKRIERDPRTHSKGSEVRYSDTELGFHPHTKA